MTDKFFIAKREDILAVITNKTEYGYDAVTDTYKTIAYFVNVHLRGCDTVCIECKDEDEMLRVFDEILVTYCGVNKSDDPTLQERS